MRSSDYGTHCDVSTVSAAVFVPSLTVIVVCCPPPVLAVLAALTVNVPVELIGDTVAIAVLLLTAVKFPVKLASLAVKFSEVPAPPLHAVPGGSTATLVGLSTMALPGLGDAAGDMLGAGDVLGTIDAGSEAIIVGLVGGKLCADCGVRVTPPPPHAATDTARTAIAGKTTDFKERIVTSLSECRSGYSKVTYALQEAKSMGVNPTLLGFTPIRGSG